MSDAGINIAQGLTIPETDVTFATARSSGPGGQHVNKTETKVTLIFDLEGTGALDTRQKDRIRERLATRISKAGALRVSSQRHRSQKANRDAAIERFATLLGEALAPQRQRKPTRVPPKAKKQRLEEKRRTAEKKKGRRGLDW